MPLPCPDSSCHASMPRHQSLEVLEVLEALEFTRPSVKF